MSQGRLSITVSVASPQGLHLRVASQFARLAARYSAKIEVLKDDLRVDGKGAMHLLMLGAEQGALLTIEADGADAAEALAALKALLESTPHEDQSEGV
jgi:phosphocarrier protein